MVAVRMGKERQVHETLCPNIDRGCDGVKESDDRSPLKRLSAWPCMAPKVPPGRGVTAEYQGPL